MQNDCVSDGAGHISYISSIPLLNESQWSLCSSKVHLEKYCSTMTCEQRAYSNTGSVVFGPELPPDYGKVFFGPELPPSNGKQPLEPLSASTSQKPPKPRKKRQSVEDQAKERLNPYAIGISLKADQKCHPSRTCIYNDLCMGNLALRLDNIVEACSLVREDYFNTAWDERGRWWFEIINSCRVPASSEYGKKLDDSRLSDHTRWAIDFAIEGVHICRGAFLRFYGFSFRDRRTETSMAMVRKGTPYAPHKIRNQMVFTRKGTVAKQWIWNYIKKHSDTPPTAEGGRGKVVIPRSTCINRFRGYRAAITQFGKLKDAEHLVYASFVRIWHANTKIWTDENGNEFDVIVRSQRTRGYGICDTCEALDRVYREAKNKEARQLAREQIMHHWTEIRSTRDTYATTILNSINTVGKWKISSWACDAADQVHIYLFLL